MENNNLNDKLQEFIDDEEKPITKPKCSCGINDEECKLKMKDDLVKKRVNEIIIVDNNNRQLLND